MTRILSFDIGGTRIKYGLIDARGTIIFDKSAPTEAHLGGEKLILKVIRIIENVIKEGYRFEGISISTAGQVCDVEGQIIYATDNLPGWTGMPIKKILENHFNLPVVVENDVNAAALGEKWIGAGKNYSDFICLTIGTGIGGAIIHKGQLYRGVKGIAGEFGHIKIVNNGIICTCGSKGCFEQYASITSLIRYVEKRNNKHEIQDINGKMIFDEAKNGNKICIEAIDYFVNNLGIGISNLIYIFNPPLIILGGGISKQGDFLLKRIINSTKQYLMPSFSDNLVIKFAELDNRAGILGAAYKWNIENSE